jgi:glycosyltransferase involved in cell wall biosynthesis
VAPLFSIISPTYNARAKLDRTLKSILSQSCRDFEYLVMDGDSKDGTGEWLAGLEDHRIRFFSEPDSGIYDAMNKAIECARGRYLFFIGAGDELCLGALERISSYLSATDPSVIYGNVVWPDGSLYAGEFSKLKLCSQNICHQAIFYGRDVFKILGNFNLKYKVLADWEFNMRCFADPRIRVQYVPVTVAAFEGGGLSETEHFDLSGSEARASLVRRNLGLFIYTQFRTYVWLKRVAKRIISLPGFRLLRSK